MTEQTANGDGIAQASDGSTAIVNITGVSPEQFATLAEELGITKAALKNFFKILQQQNVAHEDYDHTLRQIAERYNNLVEELANFQADAPAVKTLLTQAELALKEGEFVQAEDFINQASAKDLQVAEQLQETADNRLVSAAEAKAKNGELNLTQLKYSEAAGYFQKAAEIVPQHHAELVGLYVNEAGLAFYHAGKYSKAEPLYQRALQIREKVLGAEHPDVAQSLNNLAELYRAQGLYGQAEPLYQRALQILETVLGAEHPNTKTVQENYNGLLAKMK